MSDTRITMQEAAENIRAFGQFLNEHGTTQALREGRHWFQMREDLGTCGNCEAPGRLRQYHGTEWMLCDDCFHQWEAADFKRIMDPANDRLEVWELRAQIESERSTHPDYAPLK